MPAAIGIANNEEQLQAAPLQSPTLLSAHPRYATIASIRRNAAANVKKRAIAETIATPESVTKFVLKVRVGKVLVV